MSLGPRSVQNPPARSGALLGVSTARAGAAHVPFWVIRYGGDAAAVALKLRAADAAAAFGQPAQEGGAVHAELPVGCGRARIEWWLAFLAFQAAKPVALFLEHSRLKACGNAAVNARGRQAGFIVAARLLRRRQASGGVGYIGAAHQQKPQSGGGDWFQHLRNLLCLRNLAPGGRFVMRNYSAIGARQCT